MRPLALRNDERGIALILSLFLVMTMSVLAATLMFLSQTETFSSMNYKIMSQARYAAESGVASSVNFLLNGYVPPGQNVNDPLANYDMTKSPVQSVANGNPVVLSAMPQGNAHVANYPIEAVRNAFSAASQGTLSAGIGTASYNSYATLLSMQVVNGTTVMTWQITSDGTITTGRTATVEVTSVLEKQLTPQPGSVYGAFATGQTCGALTISSATVDSYDSSALAGGNPVFANSGASIGTNGNVNLNNSATVYGNVYTPRTGVGACATSGVSSSQSNINCGAGNTGSKCVSASQVYTPPTPPIPNLTLTAAIKVTDVSNCGGVAGCTKNMDGSKTYTPGNYGNFTLTDTATMHFSAGTYNINSVNIDNASKLILDSGPVTINIIGVNADGTPMSQPFLLNSSVVKDPSAQWDPTQFVINYAGTGNITLDNHATDVGLINAPNADVNINSSKYYGSVVGKTVTLGNATSLYFDRHLAVTAPLTFVVGNDMLTAFTWKKY